MAEIVRIPRHSTVPRHRTAKTGGLRLPRLRVGVRALLASAGAVLAGVLIAVAGTTGSFALWNHAAPIADASVTSGSLGLTVKYGSGAAGSTAAIPTASWSSMLPGDYVGQQITVASTGSVAGSLTARLSATTPYQIRIAAGSCPSTLMSTAALTTTASALGTIAAGASQNYCVQVALPASAAASVSGTSSPFTITIGANS
jgi:hypothetical protein